MDVFRDVHWVAIQTIANVITVSLQGITMVISPTSAMNATAHGQKKTGNMDSDGAKGWMEFRDIYGD